ncbi:MAG: hypothetical protein KAW09_03890, partial [Thermoplasmata archaeon]|nr:hypothetical protein [Thermoplasmata archaeon]
NVFLAVVFTGHETKRNLRPLKEAIKDVERNYSRELESWDGFMNRFDGVQAILHRNLGDLKGSQDTDEVLP